ncbi:hypothetical protein B0H13DRAFT_1910263 [Mycena leptocephala]|nr:hypothetical protein B0H13DRAFT_1910263 [Mycena leptocephala]
MTPTSRLNLGVFATRLPPILPENKEESIITFDSLVTEALPLAVAVIVLKVAVGVTVAIVTVSVGRNTRQVVNTTSDGMGCGSSRQIRLGRPEERGVELNPRYHVLLTHPEYHACFACDRPSITVEREDKTGIPDPVNAVKPRPRQSQSRDCQAATGIFFAFTITTLDAR